MALLEINPDLRRVASALERIAAALELATGIARPSEAGGDESAAMVHDDVKAAIREIQREDYMMRTGIILGEDEDPPAHGGDFK